MASTLLLTRADVASLVSIDECIDAVEEAFRRYGQGRTVEPGVLGMHVADGGFHVKAAVLELSRPYFAAKLNANFPGNPLRGSPTIQGAILLCDAENGSMLAIMDSIEITILRTAAATAVAARYLALPDARVMTIVGCGNQGRASMRSIACVRPIQSVHLWDIDPARAAQLAREQDGAEAVEDWHAHARQSDIVVTCTPAKRAFLGAADLRPGAFVAAVGADNPDKQEIEPALMAAAAVVTDITAQSATIGDLRHAIAAGVMTAADVRADLGGVVVGRQPGRTNDREVVVFDSTGTALQDVAVAALAYERAIAAGRGTLIQLA
jgi:ornithine cyclodeaminase/alanine dehydrogenase-like protein (mu-crystallin family)